MQKYRLVTRSDFDGLVCAVLLKQMKMIDDILFVHPKDMQDGKINITGRDITTNLPYVPAAHLVFDHHESELSRIKENNKNHIIMGHAPSAARVVYEYYGGKKTFPNISDELMEAVDKADSAQYAMNEVLHPAGWELLNFIMDARTGLGRFRDFRISNYQLMMQLIDHVSDYSIEQILALEDVKERVDLYKKYADDFKKQILRCANVYGDVVVLDLRREEIIYPGNRFMIYALFPESKVSIHVIYGLKQQNTVFAVGRSIFDRSSKVNIGELMLKYGGGGHAAAGTCQVPNEQADELLKEVVHQLDA